MARADAHFALPSITLEAAGDSPEVRQETLNVVLDSAGFPSLALLLVDMIRRRGDMAILDFGAGDVAIKFQIDGLWHPAPGMEKGAGELFLASLKHLAGCRYEERQARQEGAFKAQYENIKYKFRLLTQGMKGGERAALYLEFKRPPLETLEQLGIREGLKTALARHLSSPQGLALCCGWPGEGFTSVWRGFLGACDRFTRDHYVVEDRQKAEPEVINVNPVPYDGQRGETAFTGMRQLLLREPEVVAFAELPNGGILNQILKLADEEELFTLSRLPGKHAVDALTRLGTLQPDPALLSKHLKCILAMRVVRKLCPTCRVPFSPSPELLNSLGVPPGRVRHFYKAALYKPGVLDEKGKEIPPCRSCLGTGYLGRTGLFELLEVTEGLRLAIARRAKPAELLATLQDGGHISMRDESVLLLARGTTSLEELQRVMNKT